MADGRIGMGEAAQLTGRSKSTLLRAVKAGRLSAERDDAGAWRLDPAELARVYDVVVERSDARTVERHASPDEAAGAPDGAGDAAVLRERVAGLESMLAELRERLDDAKGERDGWRSQAEAAQRLLADRREGGGLIARLLGRAA